MSEFQNQHLQSSINSITDAVSEAKLKNSDILKTFVEDICRKLCEKLVISQDALGAFMILNKADQEQFAHWLTVSVKDMAQTLKEKFKKSNIKKKFRNLSVKPQNELFTKLIECGKQCPFFKSPCEAGGAAHTEHWASLHRPQGLGGYTFVKTRKLVTDICSSSVISDASFQCDATNYESHPYKLYKDIFPDWNIPPDVSLEASDYWKYVMAKFNKDFAEAYKAEPAEILEAWYKIPQDTGSRESQRVL
ncbi:hypothetical protein Q8A73_002815 [Channa argus]|nr:hypothetical protein Q8A73_002815 [Channa argus]